jgi:hypothetical protein
MKSTETQLTARGFLPAGFEADYLGLLAEEQFNLLQSKLPAERTLGARLLGLSKDVIAVDWLIQALQTEKKLYTKIEISNSLSSYGKTAVVPLIELLGKIGKNQHTMVSGKDFRKESYPLPRDIASRTIIRIGSKALPELFSAIETADIDTLSEAIDTIGFIHFYDKQPEVYSHLYSCFQRNINNELIKWKIIRAFSGCTESTPFLHELLSTENNVYLIREIERSLLLIDKRKI